MYIWTHTHGASSSNSFCYKIRGGKKRRRGDDDDGVLQKYRIQNSGFIKGFQKDIWATHCLPISVSNAPLTVK